MYGHEGPICGWRRFFLWLLLGVEETTQSRVFFPKHFPEPHFAYFLGWWWLQGICLWLVPWFLFGSLDPLDLSLLA